VYVDGRRYDDELLELGYAPLLIIPPNGAHARAMLQEELAAKAARRGLWVRANARNQRSAPRRLGGGVQ
jgi:endonuclease YncB( thermonuclease family)